MRGLAALLAIAAVSAIAAPPPARAHVRTPARSHAARVRGHSERLAARAQAGDREARRILVEEHMPLIRSVAGRYRGLGLPAEDLEQEGAIGLLKAIDDFDPSRATSFSTHAFWRARSEITHALTARGHVVRLPRPLLDRRREVATAWNALARQGREPNIAALTAATGLVPGEVEEALALPLAAESLDAPAADGSPRVGRLAAEDDVASEAAASSERAAVAAAVEGLPPRKREIVKRHFGIGRTPEPLEEIATDLELSPARTRALKEAALNDLATTLEPALASIP